MNTKDGYNKRSLTDTRVLMAGGGDKNISDIINEYGAMSISPVWSFSNPISGDLLGNATTADRLKNARTINGVSFDGSGNITITASASDVYSWAKASSKPSYTFSEITGTIDNSNLPTRLQEYHTSNSSDVTTCGWIYTSSGGPFDSYHTSNTDFMCMTNGYSSSWGALIATDFRSNRMAVRNKNNGTWNTWNEVVTCLNEQTISGNKTFSGTTTIDSLTAGNLTVNGASTLTGNTNAGEITATSFIKSGGTSSEFLKADGSVDSNTYALSSSLLSHLVYLGEISASGGTSAAPIDCYSSSWTGYLGLVGDCYKISNSGYIQYYNITGIRKIITPVINNELLVCYKSYTASTEAGCARYMLLQAHVDLTKYVATNSDYTITGTWSYSASPRILAVNDGMALLELFAADGSTYKGLMGYSESGVGMYDEASAIELSVMDDGTLKYRDWSGTDVVAYDLLTLNGTANLHPSWYAPTSAGTAGLLLVSSGSGEPSWTNNLTLTKTVQTVTTASTLASLNTDYNIIYATVSAATDISLSAAMSVGLCLTVIIQNSTSTDITQPIPTSTTGWTCYDGDSMVIPANGMAELSILCYASGMYSVAFKHD